MGPDPVAELNTDDVPAEEINTGDIVGQEAIEQLIRDSVTHKFLSLKRSKVFFIGEEIDVKGLKFVVSNVTTHKLILTKLKGR